MSDRHHTKSHHFVLQCMSCPMYLICQVGPSNFLLQIQRNAEGWLDDRHQLHRESLLVEDFLFTLEVGFADYCVQPGRKQWRGVFWSITGFSFPKTTCRLTFFFTVREPKAKMTKLLKLLDRVDTKCSACGCFEVRDDLLGSLKDLVKRHHLILWSSVPTHHYLVVHPGTPVRYWSTM